MSLECPRNKATLHRLGTASIQRSPEFFRVYQKAKSPSQEPKIPSPDLFRFPSRPEPPSSSPTQKHHPLPSPADCAVHLELLQTLYLLRQTVLASESIDKHYPIHPHRTEKTGKKGDKKTLKDNTLWTRRQVKWPTFVDFAVVRFLAWREWLNDHPADAVDEVSLSFLGSTSTAVRLKWLPPLDVLMVWHALLLNPKTFFDNCKDEILYKIKIPWAAIHRCINPREWTYTPPGFASDAFESSIGLDDDLVQTLSGWKSRSYTFTDSGLHSYALNYEKPARQPKLLGAISDGDTPTERYQNLFLAVGTSLPWALRSAVIRQGSFVDKMGNHLWIRSPAVEGTLRRAILRYGRFLSILKRHPGRMAVPTLDIDLVWHTHQCMAGGYRAGVTALAGRFVNHDDTVEGEKLGDGFGWTSGVWKVEFGREYAVCGCWDCEMLLSELEDAMGEGEKGEVTPGRMAEVAKRAADMVQYYRAVEMAVRKKEALPLFVSCF